jgi:sec-independent protein translocase protein TatB
MFDISWTEFLLIGVVALIVIGPKELPAVLRTLGQWTRKVRGMAADFQNQFQEAMREAEMADLKKQVDDIAHDIKHYDPLKDVRADVEAAGKDIQASLEQKPAPATLADVAAAAASAEASVASSNAAAIADLHGEDIVGAATGPVAPEAIENSAPELPAPEPSAEAPEGEIVAAAVGPLAPEASETAADPDGTRRAG